jgi:hypothetical protein
MKTKIKWVVALVGACALLGVAFAASAQTEDPASLYLPITRINITEGDVIEAPLNRPDQILVQGRPDFICKSLIRVRENFRSKIIRSAGDL